MPLAEPPSGEDANAGGKFKADLIFCTCICREKYAASEVKVMRINI